MSITPKDWATFQHYKRRRPPWIRLYRTLLDNYEFGCLPVASKALAPCLWLIASEYKNGTITVSVEALAFRMRMSRDDFITALRPLIDTDFFAVDDALASMMLAPCGQHATPETETEAEKKETQTANAVCAADAAEPQPSPVYTDSQHELWGEGVAILTALGVQDRTARSNIGRWLRDARNDAVAVLGAIQRARDARVIDPVPWITRAILTPIRGKPYGQASTNGLAATLGQLREHNAGQPDRGEAGGGPPTRLLQDRRRE
jgi:hypothetical protein